MRAHLRERAVPGARAALRRLADPMLGRRSARGVAPAGESSHVRCLKVGGLRREYRLDLPADASDRNRVPLIVALHGGGGTPESFARNTGLDKRAPAGGYAVAYPKGVGRTWNADYCCGAAAELDVDDIGFIDAMVRDIGRSFPVDLERVSAVGFSNGGALAYLLACRRSDLFRAVVVGGTGLPPGVTCRPRHAVSILHFHGTADRHHPYAGGKSVSKAPGDAILRGAPATIDEWTKLDGCVETSRVSYENGAARCVEHRSCRDGARVILCTVEGMGHQWPGGRAVLAKRFGPGSDDLDGTAMALEFLKDRSA